MTGRERSVYCACGAQWHGRYVRSPYLAWHQRRHGFPIARAAFERLGFKVKRPPHWKNVERWARRAREAQP